ncbi:3-dehydroquinate synthase [Actinoallomurus spadix]|uniref:3-dehydroquinate synthase n=1 Tax=Actinoallomurus spadix TaxID=79912 RepID=A0ABP3GFJ6_9ACTN|nr:3-dehydroquinate synthase [Actinoallomurus spadix]MCO5991687.1 3-dehydroquinate synthase [Actinoallomurus spadix]
MAVNGHIVRDRIPLSTPPAALQVTHRREDTYRIHITADPQTAHQALLDELDGRRAAVITERTVASLPPYAITSTLQRHGLLLGAIAVPPGERSKTLDTAYLLIDWLTQLDLARRDVIIALGGGMIIDTVGWVASAYMRGVPYINVPTTLLAQVDAALGGKVAVDHNSAKNLVGAFHQPRAVISCLTHLDTLDTRQTSAGLAEAVKKAVIASPEFFDFIEAHTDDLLHHHLPATETLVRAASAIKSELVGRDPYEQDLRRPLNFGHTVGHAVETTTGYGPVLHGEAVAFGMVIAADIARARGLLDPATADRITHLLTALDLPVRLHQLRAVPPIDDVLAALGKIRQIRDGSLRFVLPLELGTTLIADDVTEDEVRDALLRATADDLPAGCP